MEAIRLASGIRRDVHLKREAKLASPARATGLKLADFAFLQRQLAGVTRFYLVLPPAEAQNAFTGGGARNFAHSSSSRRSPSTARSTRRRSWVWTAWTFVNCMSPTRRSNGTTASPCKCFRGPNSRAAELVRSRARNSGSAIYTLLERLRCERPRRRPQSRTPLPMAQVGASPVTCMSG